MFTTEGGVEIEQVAAESPDALVRIHVDPLDGYYARRLGRRSSVDDEQTLAIVEKLYRCFTECDATALRDQSADRHAGR